MMLALKPLILFHVLCLILAACVPAPAVPVAPTATASAGTALTPGNPASTTDANRSLLRVGMTFDVRTLDPHLAYESTAVIVLHSIYETLVTYENNDFGAVVPAIAERWSISDDLKQYSFQIRNNIRFAGGNPVTAEDVRFSFQRLIHMKGNPARLASKISEVSVPAANTVKIVLKEPDPAFLPLLTSPYFSILDSVTLKQNGGTDAVNADKLDKTQTFFILSSAGSGPFVIKSFSPKTEITMERNPTYWRGAAKLERIILQSLPDIKAQKLSIENGTIDIALDITTEQTKDLNKSAGINILTGKTFHFIYIALNMSPEIGKEVRLANVQNAVRLAIDYEGLVKLAGGSTTQLNSIVPDGIPETLPQASLLKTDIAEAKKLLASENLANGFRFKLSFPARQVYDGILMDPIAEKIRLDLAKVNITVDLNPVEEDTLLTSYRAGREQALIMIWQYDLPDPSNGLEFVPPDGGLARRVNWTTADPEIEALRKNQLNSVDPKVRYAAYRQLQQILMKRSPFIVLIQPGTQFVVRNTVTGISYNPVWTVEFVKISKQ